MLRHIHVFTFAELRKRTGISQHSLVKYLHALVAAGWITRTQTGLRTMSIAVLWPTESALIRLPVDLLLDPEIPHAARWVWGVIRRLGDQFDYQKLAELTGYSRNSLAKYIKALQDGEWLLGQACRIKRRKWFALEANNPPEANRQKALDAFFRAKAAAEGLGRPFGQFLAVRMIEVLTGARVLENAAPNWLDNLETGGRMEYDILLFDHNVAYEFQGPQHERETDLFPGEERLRKQMRRDQLKREKSLLANVKLYDIWARQLDFEHLTTLLQEAGVPVRPIPDHLRYVYWALNELAGAYRAVAERDSV